MIAKMLDCVNCSLDRVKNVWISGMLNDVFPASLPGLVLVHPQWSRTLQFRLPLSFLVSASCFPDLQLSAVKRSQCLFQFPVFEIYEIGLHLLPVHAAKYTFLKYYAKSNKLVTI